MCKALYLLLLIIALASVSSSLLPTSATSSTCTIPTSTNAVGSVVRTTNNAFYSITYDTTISWSQTLYASAVEAQASANCIAFANGALGSASSPSWTFAAGIEYANATWITATSSELQFNVTAPVAGQSWAYFFYYYPSTSHFPTEVEIGTSIFGSNNFFTNYANFQASISQAVFLNTTGSYIETKSNTDPVITLLPNQVQVLIDMALANLGVVLSGTNTISVTYISGGSSTSSPLTDGSNTIYTDQNTIFQTSGCSTGSNSSVRWCPKGGILQANSGSGSTYSVTWDYYMEFSIPVSYTASGTLGGIFASNPYFDYIQSGTTQKSITLSQTPTSYWIDNNSVVTPQNPWYNNGHNFVPSPTLNTLSAKGTSIVFAYGAGQNLTTTCATVQHTDWWWNTTQLWQNGCVAPAFVWTFADVVTLPGFYAFLVGLIDVPILIKSKNFLMAMTIGLVVGSALVSATNVLATQIQVLLWIGTAVATAFVFVRLLLGHSQG